MKAQFLLSVAIFSLLTACEKSITIEGSRPTRDLVTNGQDTSSPGLFGTWTWVHSTAGAWNTAPSVDSVITMTLNTDNTYTTAINGKTFSSGIFQFTGTPTSPATLHFSNIPATAYSTGPGGEHLIQYGAISVGDLFLFVDNEASLGNDSLTLMRTPISPEDYIGLFTK